VARWQAALVCAGFLSSGCMVGDISDPGPGDPGPGQQDPDPDPEPEPEPDPDYSLLLTPDSQELTLGTSTELLLAVSSSHFDGAVSLAASGVPESWIVTFDPPQVALLADETAEVRVLVEVPSGAEATTATLAVLASAEIGTRDAIAEVTVDNLLLVPIEAGTGEEAHSFPQVAEVRLGATIRFVNYDGDLHRIHASDGDAGFPHQGGPGMVPSDGEGLPGGAYTVEITAAGEYEYYCHEHGRGSGVGVFAVLAP
jgi:plastocyanin